MSGQWHQLPLVIVIPVLLLGGCTPKPNPLPPEKLREVLRERIKEMAVPGFSVAVTEGAQVIWSAGYGLADVASGTKSTASTTYMWFSMTKMVTATAVMLLVERGLVALDDPVRNHLPELFTDREPRYRDMTVRNLLSHSSGLPNPIPLNWIHLEGEKAPESAVFLPELLKNHGELKYVPGEDASYSNIGYLVLGELVARVSGKTYEAFVTEEILQPLGMMETGFAHQGTIATQAATGHQRHWTLYGLALRWMAPNKVWGPDVNGFRTFGRFYVNGAPWGGLIGSVDDAARFLVIHTGGGKLGDGRMMKDGTVKLMQHAYITKEGEPMPFGLGWHVGDTDNRPYIYHMGGGAGFFTEMRIYPEERLGIVAMANGSGKYSPIVGELRDIIELVAAARWE